MSADARPARNTATTDAAEIIDPNTLRPFIQPPPRGVGASVPVRFATALATHFWGGCRRRKPVVRGTRNFRWKKEGARRERKKKK